MCVLLHLLSPFFSSRLFVSHVAISSGLRLRRNCPLASSLETFTLLVAHHTSRIGAIEASKRLRPPDLTRTKEAQTLLCNGSPKLATCTTISIDKAEYTHWSFLSLSISRSLTILYLSIHSFYLDVVIVLIQDVHILQRHHITLDPEREIYSSETTRWVLSIQTNIQTTIPMLLILKTNCYNSLSFLQHIKIVPAFVNYRKCELCHNQTVFTIVYVQNWMYQDRVHSNEILSW